MKTLFLAWQAPTASQRSRAWFPVGSPPFSPPSGPAQRLFQGLSSKSKFLAAATISLSLLLAFSASAELNPVPYTIPGDGLGLILTADLNNDGALDVVDRHDNQIY